MSHRCRCHSPCVLIAVSLLGVISLCLTALCRAQDSEPQAKPRPQNVRPVFIPKITISKETTWATEPIGPSGFIDYLSVTNRHYSQGVTPENNAVVMLYQATGPAPDHHLQPDKFFQLLGIKPPPNEGDYFETVGEWRKRTGKVVPEAGFPALQNLAETALTRPWTAKEFPEIAEWLHSIEIPLRRITEGTERTEYYSPYVSSEEGEGKMFFVTLPGIQVGRAIARALVSRAMLSLGENERLQAWSDLQAVHRLGRLMGRGPSTVEGFTGFIIETMAIDGELRFLSETRPTAKFIARYLKQLQNLPPRSLMADKMDHIERATFLDCCQHMARGQLTIAEFSEMPNFWHENPEQTWADKLLEQALIRLVDWDEILKSGNRWYDRCVSAAQLPTYRQRTGALKNLDQEIQQLRVQTQRLDRLSILVDKSKATRYYADTLVSIFLSGVVHRMGGENVVRQRFQNLELAFALAAWRSEHDSYPANLAELAPQYIPAISDDLFNNQPLHYQQTASGYRLYSVGKNEKDDLGLAYGDGKDDLIIQMPFVKPAH
ncbi:MAG: hypothetical protein JWM11_1549 [Planctomycetaceae bacterium]|nr:hypothetical protein [Planctomycetaceae bacterium]